MGKAFELCIHGVLLSFEILEMFELNGEGSLEGTVERLTE
jgi:hypothetical protein